MRRALVAMLVIGLVAAADAPARPSYYAHMSGAQYVRDMRLEPDGGLNSFKRERAMGYMDGVMDASVGVRWCPGGREVSHEINYHAAEEMLRLSPAQLQGSAATLILDVLGKLYPCPAARGKS